MIDWTTALAPGAQVVPVVLVVGVPVVLAPAGIHPTTVAGTPAALWWPGTGTLTQTLPAGDVDPVYGWLDPGAEWRVSERVDLLKGDIKVEALRIDLYDADGAVAAQVSSPRTRQVKALAADLAAAGASVTLDNITSVAAAGVAHVGREAIAYDSAAASALGVSGGGGSGRGKFGSLDRGHVAPVTNRPVVSFGNAPRWWHGREVRVFLCVLDADGVTLRDPSLFFLGTAGNGVALTASLTRWQLPVDHVAEILVRALDAPSVELYGVAHPATLGPSVWTPLSVVWVGSGAVELTSAAAYPDSGGYHISWTEFVHAWNDRALTHSAVFPTPDLAAAAGERLLVTATAGASSTLDIRMGWDEPQFREVAGTGIAMTSARALPDAYLHLDGPVKVWGAADFARVPATLSYTVAVGALAGRADYTLSAKTDARDRVDARILARTATGDGSGVLTVASRVEASYDRRLRATLITRRTPAKLGVLAAGDRWDAALQAAGSALAALHGLDGAFDDAMDWADVARQLDRYPSPFPAAREYRLVDAVTFLEVVVRECRLGGFLPAVRAGRVTIVRVGDVALTEGVAASVADADIAATGEQVRVTDTPQGVATGVSFGLADGRTVVFNDTTLIGDFGEGATIAVKGLGFSLVGLTDDLIERDLRDLAWAILGPLAQPYRLARLPLPPTYAGVCAGDVLSVTHHSLPDWSGARGVAGVAMRVQEVSRVFFGGRARVEATVRLPAGAPKGYAPAGWVAAGGVAVDTPSAGQSTVTLSAATAWGASGFAPDVAAAGVAVTNGGASWFVAGDKVFLSVADSRTPATDEAFTVVSQAGATVVLDANPTVAITVPAAGAYGVRLRYRAYADATRTSPTPGQHDFAFIASAAGVLGAADAGHAWSA